MKRCLTIALAPGVALLVGMVLYTAFYSFVLGEYEPKFGRFGAIVFAAFMACVMLGCSFLGHILVCIMLRHTVYALGERWFFGVIATLTAGQVALLSSMSYITYFSISGMMAIWAVLSAAIALVTLCFARSRIT